MRQNRRHPGQGRRPGSFADLTKLTKLSQHFDVLHILGGHVEPQDVPAQVRHYAMMRLQLTLSAASAEALDAFIARRAEEGGAPPLT